MTEINRKPSKRIDLTIKELGDDVMFYDAANEKVHVLNHTAYLIWKLCDGKHTFKDIEEKMVNNFPSIEHSELLDDIEATIEEFSKNKLLM
jgi:hypothetical protein